MFDAHEKRLAELDDELRRCDGDIENLLERGLTNPAAYRESLEHARSRRAIFERERDDLQAGLEVLRRRELSAVSVAQREQGRLTLMSLRGYPEQRRETAANLDQAAEAFLAAMDEMIIHGNAAAAAVQDAAIAATPRVMTDPQHVTQRRLMIEGTVPHATAFNGPAMKFALVIFLSRILERVENGKGVAQIAGGWQFDNTTNMPFALAAQMATEAMAHGAQRIAAALAEPK